MGFGLNETVGPYKITEYVGQGGMATIYKAHQTTLDRDVALKVIHPALKDDQSFIMRLNREAAIVAQLNHPNIVTVYDFGEFEGTPYLVMRFIQGKTLKAVLQEQKLSTERILIIARAIGNALSYAHAHNVLHRDVKPSNVLTDAEGNIYLTDFGLARLAHTSESTLSRDMLIGSPHYISPEQAKSEPVDERSDIYSFGVVLYEMFTGRLPFAGETPYQTIMSHINDPVPPPRSINPDIPPAVEKVLEKALAKDRDHRYSSVDEMVCALENAIRGPQTVEDPNSIPILLDSFDTTPRITAVPPGGGDSPPESAPSSGRMPDKRLLIGAVAILAVCLIGICAVTFTTFQQPGFLQALGLAPKPTPVPVTITTRVFSTPVVTPTLSILPTAVVVVPTATVVRPQSTAVPAGDVPKGKIAYSVSTGDRAEQHSIWLANANGTEPRLIAETAIWPALSPDGRFVAYFRMKGPDGIFVSNSDGSSPRQVIGSADTCCVQWSPDSKHLVYFRGSLKNGGSIYIADPDGTNPVEVTQGFNPSYSPDGNRLAYANCQANSSQCGLFIVDLKTKASTMITRDNGANPQWSPRGDRLVYQADDGKGHVNVFIVNADGTGSKQLTSGKSNDGQPVWSRDGNFIFWRSDQNGAGWGIFAMRADGTSPRLIIDRVAASIYWGRESLTTAP